MPDSFFNKLNTLVQAHINNIIDPIDETTSKSRKKALSRRDIRGGLQKDVQVLRQRVEEALQYETKLQTKTDKLYEEIADLDQQANIAVQENRENDARSALSRMQQAQRELEMLEADLREHRTITQELISQVNMLDSTIQAAEDQYTEDDDGNINIPVSSSSSPEPATEDIGAQIVKQLDNTRQNLSSLITEYTAKVTGDEQPRSQQRPMDDPPQPQRPLKHPVDKNKVDDELSARINRLSKPDDK